MKIKTMYLCVLLGSVILIACERKSPIEEAADDVGDAIEEGVDEVGDAVDRAD